MTINPLVAARVEGPKDAWAGVWIAEDIELIHQGVKNGSWVDGGFGVVGATLDGLALISDPLGSLLQYGVAWLIEHIKPLSEALDWLAGDPAQIAAHAQTWRNVSVSLLNSATDLVGAVRTEIADWEGAASDAYRVWAAKEQTAVAGLARAAETMAAITEGAGFLIATVRLIVRDAIATVVSRAIAYALEEAFSLGLATPLVIEQVSTLVASWGAKIAHWIQQLLASLRRLMPLIRRLGELVGELKKLISSLRASPAGSLFREGDGIVRNGAKILMTSQNVLAVASKYGLSIDMRWINIDKVRGGSGPGKELYGITNDRGKITLTRDAFLTEEELARTLAHELFHRNEILSGMHVPHDPRLLAEWEARAKAFEKQWWEEHKHLF